MNITEEQFLQMELTELKLTLDNLGFVALAKEVANYLSKYKNLTILDYGCGTGVYSEILRRNNFKIKALDIFKPHRDYCNKNYKDLTVLKTPIPADVMLFIEVAEHMTDLQIREALNKIIPQHILFSSTPNRAPNDADWGHINIKSEKEWLSFFNGIGYKLIDKPQTPTLWTLMFTKYEN